MVEALEKADYFCTLYAIRSGRAGARGLAAALYREIGEEIERQRRLGGEPLAAMQRRAVGIAERLAMEHLHVEVGQVGLERLRQNAQDALEALAFAVVEFLCGVEYAEDQIDARFDTDEALVEVEQP